MGMYTELVMNVGLKDDTPPSVITLLKRMIEGEPWSGPLPDHPLFKTGRWFYMLNTGSHYFVPQGSSKLIELDYTESKYLTIRTDFKNYDNEIRLFADWIAPYIEDGDEFAGYSRYEEDEHPTLLYFKNGKPVWAAVRSAVE